MTTSVFLTVLLIAAAPVPEPKPANARYGDAVVAILKGAKRVEIACLDPVLMIRTPVAPAFQHYPVRAFGKEQGEAYAVALGKVVLEEANLPQFQPVVNFFEPGIGFRLWKDKEKVEVLLDLRSRNLQVIGYDADGKIIKQIFSSAHAATYNALLKRAQEAFPDDGALRQIKEITDADRADVIRVNPGITTVTPVAPSFGGYAVSAIGKERGEAYAAALDKVLLEEAKLPPAKPVNLFEPQIGFRLWKGKEKVEVLFDPQSRNVQVIGYDADGKILEQTLNVAHPTTFNALLKRAQEAFPDDDALRQIKEIAEK